MATPGATRASHQFESMQPEPTGVDWSPPPPPPAPRVRATPVRTLEDGTIEYSDGSIRRENGTLVKLSPQGSHNVITSERSRELRELRKRKTAQLTRQKIAAVMAKKTGKPIETGSEAIAEATAQLFEEIVVDPGKDVRAGDRARMLVTTAQISETAMMEPERHIEEGGSGISLHMNLGKELSERVRSVILKRMDGLPGEGLPASGDQGGAAVEGEIVE